MNASQSSSRTRLSFLSGVGIAVVLVSTAACAAPGHGVRPTPTVTAYAEWVVYDSVEALVENSDAVVVGEVVAVRHEIRPRDLSYLDIPDPAKNPYYGVDVPQEVLDQSDPVTIYTVTVLETVAGDVLPGQQIEVAHFGGPFGDQVLIKEGVVPLELNSDYLLMLYQVDWDSSTWYTVGGHQGQFKAGSDSQSILRSDQYPDMTVTLDKVRDLLSQ